MSDASTEPRTSAVPLRKNQPGLGRAATAPAEADLGPTPNRSVTKIQNYSTRRAARLAERD